MNYIMFPIEMGMDLRAELTPEQERNLREKLESWYGNDEPSLDQIFEEASDVERRILFRYAADLQNPKTKFQKELDKAEAKAKAKEERRAKRLELKYGG